MTSLVSEGFAPIRFSRSRFHSSSAPPFLPISTVAFGADEAKDAEDEESAAAGALLESACDGVCATEARCVHQYQPPKPIMPKTISNTNATSSPCRICPSGGAVVSVPPYAVSIVSEGGVFPFPDCGWAVGLGTATVACGARTVVFGTSSRWSIGVKVDSLVSANRSGAAYHS